MREKVKQVIKTNYKIIILVICLIIFLGILEDVFEEETMRIDTIIYKIVVQNMRNDNLTNIFKIITNLGSAYSLIFIAIMSFLVIKDKRISISISVNLMISTLLNFGLKNLIERPRPIGYRLIDEKGYSFPSGHSMVSMAFYGLIIYFIWKKIENKKIRNLACTLLGILIILIGTSRIYLGVHYASDVIAGFLISIIYLIVFTTIYKNIIKTKEK